MHDLLEVMFGIEHVIAEFFWNAVFAIAVFALSKSSILSRIHKYIDDRHEVKHDKY